MLNNIGIGGILLIAIVVLVLFGRGKIAGLMGEVGKGITAFRSGMKDATNAEIEDQTSASETESANARDVTPQRDHDPA
jgi:sec-independent protein translocase protein TatA